MYKNIPEIGKVGAGCRPITRRDIESPLSFKYARDGLAAPDAWPQQLSYREGYWAVIRRVEERLVRNAVEDTSGNKAEAARVLGIQRRLLYEKMNEFGIG